jgi:hypothetical protein
VSLPGAGGASAAQTVFLAGDVHDVRGGLADAAPSQYPWHSDGLLSGIKQDAPMHAEVQVRAASNGSRGTATGRGSTAARIATQHSGPVYLSHAESEKLRAAWAVTGLTDPQRHAPTQELLSLRRQRPGKGAVAGGSDDDSILLHDGEDADSGLAFHPPSLLRVPGPSAAVADACRRHEAGAALAIAVVTVPRLRSKPPPRRDSVVPWYWRLRGADCTSTVYRTLT